MTKRMKQLALVGVPMLVELRVMSLAAATVKY